MDVSTVPSKQELSNAVDLHSEGLKPKRNGHHGVRGSFQHEDCTGDCRMAKRGGKGKVCIVLLERKAEVGLHTPVHGWRGMDALHTEIPRTPEHGRK